MCFLRAASSLGVNAEGGIRHLVSCPLNACSTAKPRSRGGGHSQERDRQVPGPRELSSYESKWTLSNLSKVQIHTRH